MEKKPAAPVIEKLRRLLSTTAAFCLLVSASIVLSQIVFIYYEPIFKLQSIPGHDMYQGAPLFAMNMHSVRLSGEVVWWNPIANGSAQFYLSFLSPLTPTHGHIVFILWAQAINTLAFFGYVMPEYLQYLVVNYIVLPFLMYASLAGFLSMLFRSRWPVLLVTIVYAYSGIGLWNMAWFFPQEPFTLFLLFATALALLRRPTRRSLCWFLAAALIQMASANYWTIYNSWFFVVFVVAYGLTHTAQVRALFPRLRGAMQGGDRRTTLLTAVLIAATCIVWLVLLASIYKHGLLYTRTWQKPYTALDAYGHAPEIRWSTIELFDPWVDHAQRLPGDSALHKLRYIGGSLLPLLAILPFYRWRRLEHLLLMCAVAVLTITMAPPFLLWLWKVTPGMNRIIHTFYFYSQYWQFLVALLAGAALDRLLRARLVLRLQHRFRVILGLVLGTSVLMFAGFFATEQRFTGADVTLPANMRLALVVCVSGLILLQAAVSPLRQHLLVGSFVLLLACDLTNYFWAGSAADRVFTAGRWGGVPDPLTPEITKALARGWVRPDPKASVLADSLFKNMPIKNDFWPYNGYTKNIEEGQFRENEQISSAMSLWTRYAFFEKFEVSPTLRAAADVIRKEGPGKFNGQLVLQSPPPGKRPSPNAPSPDPSSAGGAKIECTDWLYNSQKLSVYAPADGWLFINQLPEASFKFAVDGRHTQFTKANFVGMAIPVSKGHHEVTMEYWPIARRLYGPACVLLEASLVVLLIMGVGTRAGRAGSDTIPLRNARPAVVAPGDHSRLRDAASATEDVVA